jgi:hypothetical protein
MINLESFNSEYAITRISGEVSTLISNPQDLHAYIYVGNNPINYIDPMGLKKCCIGNVEGRWRGKAFRFINIWCRCCWLCVPSGGTIWTGNWFAQPCTNGILINTRGDIERGDACLCKDPDGGSHIIPLEN